MPSEADARIVVDRLLRMAGWDIEDKSQVETEEAAADGRADYLLKNQRTQPLAPIEAKRFSVVPVPPIEDQRRFAQLRKLHFQLQRLHREAEAELASFTPALLAKAFRGEL